MQKTKENTALVWFKNNLRVQDNIVLSKACENHKKVIGVFYFEPALFNQIQFGFKKIEKYRAKFLIESVSNLRESLNNLNITLLVYYHDPSKHLVEVCEKYNVSAVYLQKKWTTEEYSTMKKVEGSLPKSIEIKSFYDQFLIHPEDVPFSKNEVPKIFTAFRKSIEKNCAPRAIVSPTQKEKYNLIENATQVPTLNDLGFDDFFTNPKSAFPFKGGENEALSRLDYYFFQSKKLAYYKKTRNGLVGADYSSKFSAWLANGSISPRMIYHKVKEFEQLQVKNQSTYWLIFELLWRDYFKYISLKFGSKIFQLQGILDRNYEWNNSEKLIHQWVHGETPEPFINANMVELKNTGWMSNRGRQNVASYFAKTLKLDWRIGAAYFESLLIDYDVHSNYGNWIYVAGVGNDPRNRVFNVKLQSERYDNNGAFQKQWLQPTLF